MEHVNDQFLNVNPENEDHLSSQQKAQIPFLNEESTINYDQNSTFTERYQGINQVEILAKNEELRLLIEYFEPESLLNLQAIGLSILDSVYDGTLSKLSYLLPVKVQLQSTLLSHPLILLILPQVWEEGLIYIQFLPYAKHIPPIALSQEQKTAMIGIESFLLIKRVIEDVFSASLEKKQNELWDSLSLNVAIGRKPFKELMEIIKYQPLEMEKWVRQQFWTETQTQHVVKLINGIFPLHVGLYTGLHLLFYPLNQLGQFPHLQTIVNKKLLELS